MVNKQVKSKNIITKLIELIKKNRQLLKFFGIFILVIALYYISVAMFNNMFDGYINFTAWISSKLFGLLGISASANANIIMTRKSILALSFGCEGTEPMVIFLAGVLAFPAGIKQKLAGLISGVLILYFLNIIRILGLYYVTILIPESFESFHVVFFPILFIILSIITFVIWMKISIKYRKRNQAI